MRASNLLIAAAFWSATALADCDSAHTTCSDRCTNAALAALTDPRTSARLEACFGRCNEAFERCTEQQEAARSRHEDHDEPEAAPQAQWQSGGLSGSGRDLSGPGARGGGTPEASSIVAACNDRCSRVQASCRAGTNSDCYRAAACQCDCFASRAPNHPDVANWRQCARDNTASAEALRGSPDAVFSSTPSPRTNVPPPRPAAPEQARQRCSLSSCANAAR